MIINVFFDSSTTGAPAGYFTAVNAAVEYWERALINPITVTIQFGYNQVDGHVIGNSALAESESQGNQFSYAQVKAGLTSAATSANDMTSIAHLPATDPTGGVGFYVPIAQEEVLGLTGTANQTVGAAGLSSAFPFTFDPNNRSAPGDFDAIGAMEHEISEVIGRIAGSGALQAGIAQFSPLDLFRYASAGQLAVTAGSTASFSIDGTHMLLPFNVATSGNDAGDWATSVHGDSFGEGSQGLAGLVSPTDLEVMDVLGFKLAVDPTARNDFAADGQSGFLIQNTNAGLVTGQVINGQAAYTGIGSLGGWNFVGDGDFLGAGNDQYLIQNSSGSLVVGAANTGQAAYTVIGALSTDWKFVGVGDYLGLADGDQFLVHSTSTSGLAVGNAESGQIVYTLVGAIAGWNFVGTGDFLGDGKSDFLIYNPTSSGVVVGEVVGGQAAYTLVGALSSEWQFVGTGDFFGDGKDDFLIHSTVSGAVVAGEVVGGHATYTLLTALDSEWKFVGTGDYLANGHDQFLVDSTTTSAVLVGDWSGGQIHFTQVGALGSEWTFH